MGPTDELRLTDLGGKGAGAGFPGVEDGKDIANVLALRNGSGRRGSQNRDGADGEEREESTREEHGDRLRGFGRAGDSKCCCCWVLLLTLPDTGADPFIREDFERRPSKLSTSKVRYCAITLHDAGDVQLLTFFSSGAVVYVGRSSR